VDNAQSDYGTDFAVDNAQIDAYETDFAVDNAQSDYETDYAVDNAQIDAFEADSFAADNFDNAEIEYNTVDMAVTDPSSTMSASPSSESVPVYAWTVVGISVFVAILAIVIGAVIIIRRH